MKKSIIVLFIAVIACSSVFAQWTVSSGWDTYIDTKESGQLTIGTPDLEKKVLVSETKGNNSVSLEVYVTSLKDIALTEWDSTGKNRVTLFANMIKLTSSDNSISKEFYVNTDYYYQSKGYIGNFNSDFIIYLFEGLCSGKDMTIELFSFVGESRKYTIKVADSEAKFFEFLRAAY